MNTIEIGQYQEEQDKTQRNYLELVSTYSDLPCDTRDGIDSNLSLELDRVECALLDNPPVYTKEDGSLGIRSKGLLMPSPVDMRLVRDAPTGDFEALEKSEWAKYITGPDAVDLSPLIYHKLDQDGVGSCGAEGLAQGVMAAHAFALGKAPKKLNPWFMYQSTSGGRDQGSSLPSNIAFARKYGVASEEVWPRSEGWRSRPSREAYEDAENHRLLEFSVVRNWIEFASALLYGWPVYFGYTGHAILAVKLLDSNRFRYINSWSEDWGDKGFGTLHKDRIYWNYGVYAIRVVTYAVAA